MKPLSALGFTLLAVGVVLAAIGAPDRPAVGIPGLLLVVLGSMSLGVAFLWHDVAEPPEGAYMRTLSLWYVSLSDTWQRQLKDPDFVLNHPAIIGCHPVVGALRDSAHRAGEALEQSDAHEAETAMRDMEKRWQDFCALISDDPDAGLTKRQRVLLRQANAKHQKARGADGIERIELEDERDAILVTLGCGRRSDLTSTRL